MSTRYEPHHLAFWGWPKQLDFELYDLLGPRDASWFASVYADIQDALKNPEHSHHRETYSANAARTEGMGLSVIFGDPGAIGRFAGIEPHYPWSTRPEPKRWERFAAFSRMHLDMCLDQLDAIPAQSGHEDLLAMTYSAAGGFALDAMRALQIAVSIKANDQDKSARGRNAALARHDAMKPKREEALAMANSKPFPTKEAALDYLTDNLTLDPEGKVFISRRTASEWLRDAQWKAKGK
jgi:hypothetical protein